jgi:hypothetical protein
MVLSKPNRRGLSRRMRLKGIAAVPVAGLVACSVFNPDLLVTVQGTGTPMQATFNFVVQV